MSTAPYPSYGPLRDSDVDVSGHHFTLTRLEYRIGVLEFRVAALQESLQETVSSWDQWYRYWNPLFRLLRWMFGSFAHRDRSED